MLKNKLCNTSKENIFTMSKMHPIQRAWRGTLTFMAAWIAVRCTLMLGAWMPVWPWVSYWQMEIQSSAHLLGVRIKCDKACKTLVWNQKLSCCCSCNINISVAGPVLQHCIWLPAGEGHQPSPPLCWAVPRISDDVCTVPAQWLPRHCSRGAHH